MKKNKLIFIILVLLFISYCYFENTIIEVNEYNVIDNNLPSAFNKLKIVHISDLHNASFGKNNSKLVNKIKDVNPDLIFITGDIIDSNHTNVDVVSTFVSNITNIAPIYYVSGNHEANIDNYNELINVIKDKCVILDNEFIELNRNNESINLIGLGDPNFVEDDFILTNEIFDKYLNDMDYDKERYSIVLSHRPEVFDYYVDNNFNLIFTGHAHGGQFRIPFIGGIIAPNQGFMPKYTSGIYELNKTKMIVNRGLGNSIIPFRINNNPEIIVINLFNK